MQPCTESVLVRNLKKSGTLHQVFSCLTKKKLHQYLTRLAKYSQICQGGHMGPPPGLTDQVNTPGLVGLKGHVIYNNRSITENLVV